MDSRNVLMILNGVKEKSFKCKTCRKESVALEARFMPVQRGLIENGGNDKLMGEIKPTRDTERTFW